MSEYQNCNNCIFYRKHYALDDNGKLYALAIGHCSNKQVAIMYFRRCFNNNLSCGHWQHNDNIATPEKIDDIIDILKKSAKRIELLADCFDIKID